MKAVKKFAPKISAGLKRSDNVKYFYKNAPNISIDYAVMEKADNVYCAKGSFRWHDMGSFENLISILKRESRDFVLEGGKIIKII